MGELEQAQGQRPERQAVFVPRPAAPERPEETAERVLAALLGPERP